MSSTLESVCGGGLVTQPKKDFVWDFNTNPFDVTCKLLTLINISKHFKLKNTNSLLKAILNFMEFFPFSFVTLKCF